MATGRAPNFNRIAGLYRWMEYLSFGPLLWRCRVRYLAEAVQRRRALVLGDGDGRFTARLLRMNSEIEVTAVDASPGMLAALTRASSENVCRLLTEVADIRLWTPPAGVGFDLIVAHFFLDCLTTEDVAKLAARVAPAVVPGGIWLVSEFAVPDTVFGRVVARPLVATLYGAFRVLTSLQVRALPGYAAALADAGWILEAESCKLNGLLVSQCWRRPRAIGPDAAIGNCIE